METHPDFSAWLRFCNKHQVEYVVVGAHALAFHGTPRYTGDLDLYVRPSAENASRVLHALEAFGFGAVGITLADLEGPGKVIQLGYPPVRIDLLTSLTGVMWDDVASGSVEGTLGDVPVRFIGRGEFATNKKALGRMKDLADLEAIGET